MTEDSRVIEKRANKGEEVGNRGAAWGKELLQQRRQKRPDDRVVCNKCLA